MSDPTREAAQTDETLRAMADAIFDASKGTPCRERPCSPCSLGEARAAMSAFLASPPDWLTALVVIVHDELCGASEHPTGCCNECLAVPPPVRSAAGLDTP